MLGGIALIIAIVSAIGVASQWNKPVKGGSFGTPPEQKGIGTDYRQEYVLACGYYKKLIEEVVELQNQYGHCKYDYLVYTRGNNHERIRRETEGLPYDGSITREQVDYCMKKKKELHEYCGDFEYKPDEEMAFHCIQAHEILVDLYNKYRPDELDTIRENDGMNSDELKTMALGLARRDLKKQGIYPSNQSDGFRKEYDFYSSEYGKGIYAKRITEEPYETLFVEPEKTHWRNSVYRGNMK